MFYKIFKKSTIPFFKLIPEKTSYVTRNADNIPLFNIKHNFKNSFFPWSIIEWNNLDPNLLNSGNFGVFKKIFLNLLDPNQTILLTAAILRGLD